MSRRKRQAGPGTSPARYWKARSICSGSLRGSREPLAGPLSRDVGQTLITCSGSIIDVNVKEVSIRGATGALRNDRFAGQVMHELVDRAARWSISLERHALDRNPKSSSTMKCQGKAGASPTPKCPRARRNAIHMLINSPLSQARLGNNERCFGGIKRELIARIRHSLSHVWSTVGGSYLTWRKRCSSMSSSKSPSGLIYDWSPALGKEPSLLDHGHRMDCISSRLRRTRPESSPACLRAPH